MKKQWAYL